LIPNPKDSRPGGRVAGRRILNGSLPDCAGLYVFAVAGLQIYAHIWKHTLNFWNLCVDLTRITGHETRAAAIGLHDEGAERQTLVPESYPVGTIGRPVPLRHTADMKNQTALPKKVDGIRWEYQTHDCKEWRETDSHTLLFTLIPSGTLKAYRQAPAASTARVSA
jgi:hypothetical protein